MEIICGVLVAAVVFGLIGFVKHMCFAYLKKTLKLNNKKGSTLLSKIRLLFIPRCVKIYKNIISRG